MVSILVLISVLIQFCGFDWDNKHIPGLLSAQTETMVDARYEAGRLAISDFAVLSDPDYIKDWDAGPDGRRHTPDDTFDNGNGFSFTEKVVNKSVADNSQWNIFEQQNELTELRTMGAGNPSSVFGLVKGSESVNIELIDAIQELVYGANSIEMKSDVWMTWTRGIY